MKQKFSFRLHVNKVVAGLKILKLLPHNKCEVEYLCCNKIQIVSAYTVRSRLYYETVTCRSCGNHSHKKKQIGLEKNTVPILELYKHWGGLPIEFSKEEKARKRQIEECTYGN